VVMCDYIRFYGDAQLGGLNFVNAVTKFGTEAAAALINEEFFALVPGLLSDNVSERVQAHLEHIRRMVGPSEADTYFWLGFNTISPPYVREGIHARVVDYDDLLRELHVPVLITHGENDRLVFTDAAEQHKKLIPHARLSIYEGVSGAPYWEDTQRFNRELREFASSVELVG
jgi:non-heme chloroperoxidase